MPGDEAEGESHDHQVRPEETIVHRKISGYRKVYHKTCRSLCKSAFLPWWYRSFLLRQTGVTVGRSVVINEGFTLVCDGGFEDRLIIGDRVAFGPNVTIVLTSHPNHSRLRAQKDIYPFIEVYGRVTIGHDAWIGAGSIILPNCIIGDCSVVGAGAVVTSDVPAYCVVAGVPARVIRTIAPAEVTPG